MLLQGAASVVRMMQRKSSTVTGFVTVMLIVSITILVLRMAVSWHLWNAQESMDLTETYYVSELDKGVQAVKHGFLKTAAFFSLNSVSKMLAEHGGYDERTLADADSNNLADATEGAEPKIHVKNGLPLWTIPNCESTLKMVPYLKDTDPNIPAGDRFLMIMVNDKDHKQYIDEINAGKYPLYISILLLMTKKGTVNVACRSDEGCLQMELVTGTPETIDRDGIYTYRIKRIDGTKLVTSLHVTGRNATSGIEDVARIKQVVVSICDPTKVITPNALFKEKLDEYYLKMKDEIAKKNADSGIKLALAPLKGAMTRGYDQYAQGIVWPLEDDKGITTDAKNLFGGDSMLAEIQNSGLVSEEAKIRYYKLYSYAEKFTDQSQVLLQSRLWDMLYSLDKNGHSGPSGDNCGRPDCSDPTWCPDDEVKSYTQDETYDAIVGAINNVAAEYSTLTSPEGVSWTMEYEYTDYAAHDPTNVNIGACDAAEHIESSNFEYLEYIKATYTDIGDDCVCEPVSYCTDCGSTSYNYKDRNRCTMDYDRRYILKNLKFRVTITDDKYRYYNAVTNSWNKLQFKFYVTVPIVDTNCCGPTGGTHFCDTHGSSCNNPYGVVTPSLSPSGPFAITSGPTADVSGVSVTIRWATNRLSDSKLKYSTTSGGPYTEVTDPTMVLAHSIGIEGLVANQQYFIVVESNDGTTTVTSSEYTFTTGIDTAEPSVSFISPKDGDNVGKIIIVQASASHSSGISKVDFYAYDNENSNYVYIGTSTASAPPYENIIDMEAKFGINKALGKRGLKITAFSNAGTEKSATIEVTVTNMPSLTKSIVKEIGTDTVKFTIDTDVPTTGVIRYGKTIMYGSALEMTTETPHHVETITGLEADTEYNYQVEVIDHQGYSAIVMSNTFKTTAA